MKRGTVLMAAGALALLLSQDAAARPARGDVSWLTKPAERAAINTQYARAAMLYQGAVTLSPRTPALLWRLAEIYTMGGQFSMAQATYRLWLKVGKDPTKVARAKSEIHRLATAPAPFVESDDTRAQVRQRTFAMRAVKRARVLRRGRKYRLAIRYLQAALVMDPTLVGAYRLIGALYGRLKDRKSEQAFYVKYLTLRPGGRLAGLVRRKLHASPMVGKVTLRASFPCMVFINRGLLDAKRKTPIKDVLLPPGEYTVVLYNRRFHFGKKIRVKVAAGKSQTVSAQFGVLSVRLKPWARVRAMRRGGRTWRDVGLWEAIGLPVGRWKVDFRTDDGKRRMTRALRIQPGKTVTVTRWQ